jgi:hypothetical protein
LLELYIVSGSRGKLAGVNNRQTGGSALVDPGALVRPAALRSHRGTGSSNPTPGDLDPSKNTRDSAILGEAVRGVLSQVLSQQGYRKRRPVRTAGGVVEP